MPQHCTEILAKDFSFDLFSINLKHEWNIDWVEKYTCCTQIHLLFASLLSWLCLATSSLRKNSLLESFSGLQVSSPPVSQAWQGRSESHLRLMLGNHSLLWPLALIIEFKSMDSEIRLLGFEFYLYHILAVWPYGDYLCLNFLICKIGAKVVLISYGCYKDSMNLCTCSTWNSTW